MYVLNQTKYIRWMHGCRHHSGPALHLRQALACLFIPCSKSICQAVLVLHHTDSDQSAFLNLSTAAQRVGRFQAMWPPVLMPECASEWGSEAQ